MSFTNPISIRDVGETRDGVVVEFIEHSAMLERGPGRGRMGFYEAYLSQLFESKGVEVLRIEQIEAVPVYRMSLHTGNAIPTKAEIVAVLESDAEVDLTFWRSKTGGAGQVGE